MSKEVYFRLFEAERVENIAEGIGAKRVVLKIDKSEEYSKFEAKLFVDIKVSPETLKNMIDTIREEFPDAHITTSFDSHDIKNGIILIEQSYGEEI